MKFSTGKMIQVIVFLVVFGMIILGAFHLADFISTNDLARELAARYGYVSIVVLAFIAGINVIVPVPAATLTPIFTSAGLWLPLIILMLVIGTTIADFVGYFLGRWSRDFAKDHYPETYKSVSLINENKRQWLIPFVFIYSAFAPFPNEAILIPIALMGIHWRTFVIPLVLGTIINQTILALGIDNIFSAIF